MIYCIVSINTFSLDVSKYKIVLFIFKEKQIVIIYNSPDKDSIVAKIKDDDKADKLYGFNVLEKQDSMIKVIAWNTINRKEITGWIKITETAIYGRTRTKNSIYELYDNPNYKSGKTLVNSNWESYMFIGKKHMKIYENIDANFRVFDISGKWLKVEVRGKDKIYRKWLPMQYQCVDVYNSCT